MAIIVSVHWTSLQSFYLYLGMIPYSTWIMITLPYSIKSSFYHINLTVCWNSIPCQVEANCKAQEYEHKCTTLLEKLKHYETGVLNHLKAKLNRWWLSSHPQITWYQIKSRDELQTSWRGCDVTLSWPLLNLNLITACRTIAKFWIEFKST